MEGGLSGHAAEPGFARVPRTYTYSVVMELLNIVGVHVDLHCWKFVLRLDQGPAGESVPLKCSVPLNAVVVGQEWVHTRQHAGPITQQTAY